MRMKAIPHYRKAGLSAKGDNWPLAINIPGRTTERAIRGAVELLLVSRRYLLNISYVLISGRMGTKVKPCCINQWWTTLLIIHTYSNGSFTWAILKKIYLQTIIRVKCQHQCTFLELNLFFSLSCIFYSGIWKIILSKSKGNPQSQMRRYSMHRHLFFQHEHNKTSWGARSAGEGVDCYYRAVLEKIR